MFKKISYLTTLLILCGITLSAQKEKIQDRPYSPDPAEDEVIQKKFKGNHDKWKAGDYPMPGKPRDMWAVGINGGYFQVSGDVAQLPGFGVGFQVRKSLGYSVSLRMGYFYGIGKGLNYKPAQAEFALGRNNVLAGLGYTNQFYYNYKTSYHQGSFEVLLNLNNLLFHRRRNRVAFYVGAGVGMNLYNTKYDALDANGQTYEAAYNVLPLPSDPSYGDRKVVRDQLRDIMDGTYETVAEQDEGFNIKMGDNVLNPNASVTAGMDFRISSRISIGLQHQSFISISDDLIDGKRWAEQGDLTRQSDIPHFTSVSIMFHLGSKKKRMEPFWFVNPFNAPLGELAQHKKKIDDLEEMLNDDDGDGVPNRLDKEPGTPPGTIVDSHGVTKDSDGDGIADSLDKEPFSPPNYPTDGNGVAKVPDWMDQPEVQKFGDERYAKKEDLEGLGKGKGLSEWFLPMIHFDLDKYAIKPEFYPELKYVAVVMGKFPELKIVVNGNTDVRNTDCYNEKLSYNRAKAAIEYLMKTYNLPRERFILTYGGEKTNLAPEAKNEKAHYMNRRVEFSVSSGAEKEMAQPSCGTGATDNGKENKDKPTAAPDKNKGSKTPDQADKNKSDKN